MRKKLKCLGLESEERKLTEIRYGDWIESELSLSGKMKIFEVDGLPKKDGRSVNLKVRPPRLRDAKPLQTTFSPHAVIRVYPKEAIANAYRELILDILQPGMKSRIMSAIMKLIEDRHGDRPAREGVRGVIEQLTEEGLVISTHCHDRKTSVFRRLLPRQDRTPVIDKESRQVGWITGFQEMQNALYPYPSVLWADGQHGLSHERNLEPVECPRSHEGIRRAIAYAQGDGIDPEFFEMTTDDIRSLTRTYPANTVRRSAVLKLAADWGLITNRPNRTRLELDTDKQIGIEKVLRLLDRHHPGWKDGISTNDLIQSYSVLDFLQREGAA